MSKTFSGIKPLKSDGAKRQDSVRHPAAARALDLRAVHTVLAFVGTVLSASVQAATPGAPAASAGTELQNIPAPTTLPRRTPQFQLERETEVPAAPPGDTVTLPVSALRVTGNTVFPADELIASTGFQSAQALTLGQLREMAARITAYYRGRGYFVAQAYLPAQDIENGVVTIGVLEGRLGEVQLRNQSRVATGLAQDLLSGVAAGDVVQVAPMERRLLLLSDLPGVQVKSTLSPGASVGASDLIVDMSDGARINGNADFDNAGGRYTGATRGGATVNLAEPFGRGDVASARVLSSLSGMDYGRLSYQAQLSALRLGVAYMEMQYRLGHEFASLLSEGNARTGSVYAQYPLVRSRTANLSAQLAYDAKHMHDEVNSTSSITNKGLKVWMASVVGDSVDAFGGFGQNEYSLTWTHGRLDIMSPDSQVADAAGAGLQGRYNKLYFQGSRLQAVTPKTSVWGSLTVQVGDKNLDGSEKMPLGGMMGVRAYPSGEANGDQGFIAKLETRTVVDWLPASLPGSLQWVNFVDHGRIAINRNPWTSALNRRSLSGAGVGLQWTDGTGFVLKGYLAHKLGNARASSAPDSSTRLWIQAVKYF